MCHSLCFHGFWREVCYSFYLCFSIGRVFFSSGFFRISCLSLIFYSLKMIGLGIVVFCFVLFLFASILLGVLWAFWISGLVSDFNLGKQLLLFQYFFCSFLSFFSFWYSCYMYVTSLVAVPESWIFCSLLFQSLFSLLFSPKNSIHMPSRAEIPSSVMSSLLMSYQRYCSVLLQCFYFLISSISFCSFLGFHLSAYIIHLFFHVYFIY